MGQREKEIECKDNRDTARCDDGGSNLIAKVSALGNSEPKSEIAKRNGQAEDNRKRRADESCLKHGGKVLEPVGWQPSQRNAR